MKINNTNLSKIVSNKEPKLQTGEIVSVKMLKLLENNTYLVSIKGKILRAIINSELALSKFKAEVVKLEPVLELKIIKEPLQKLDPIKLKGVLIKFSKSEIFDFLKKMENFDLKRIDKDEIFKLIKNSGLFLEKKILNDENVLDDAKYFLIKKDLGDIITKLQINYLINNEMIIPFKSNKYDIKDGAIKVSKKGGNFYIAIFAKFSEIGDVLIRLYSPEKGIIYVKLFTGISFKDLFRELKLKSIKIEWYPLENNIINDEFNFEEKLYSSIGKFETII